MQLSASPEAYIWHLSNTSKTFQQWQVSRQQERIYCDSGHHQLFTAVSGRQPVLDCTLEVVEGWEAVG